MTLDEAIKDLCWKATPCGHDEEETITMYLVPAGALHRLVGAAQGAGIAAALRSINTPPPEPKPEPKCIGYHARWSTCPVHGRCTCATEMAAPYSRSCPLHHDWRGNFDRASR